MLPCLGPEKVIDPGSFENACDLVTGKLGKVIVPRPSLSVYDIIS
jgi:hypothetical protein